MRELVQQKRSKRLHLRRRGCSDVVTSDFDNTWILLNDSTVLEGGLTDDDLWVHDLGITNLGDRVLAAHMLSHGVRVVVDDGDLG